MMPRRVRLHARGKYGTARKPEEVPRGFFYNFFYFLWMNPTKVGDPTRQSIMTRSWLTPTSAGTGVLEMECPQET